MFFLTQRIVTANAAVLTGLSLFIAVLKGGSGGGASPAVSFLELALTTFVIYFVLRAVLLHSEGRSFDIRSDFETALDWSNLKPFLYSYLYVLVLSVVFTLAGLIALGAVKLLLSILMPASVLGGLFRAMDVLGFVALIVVLTAGLGTMLAASVVGGDTSLRAVLARSRAHIWTTSWRLVTGPVLLVFCAAASLGLLIAVLPYSIAGSPFFAFVLAVATAFFTLVCTIYVWAVVAVAYVEAKASGAVAE